MVFVIVTHRTYSYIMLLLTKAGPFLENDSTVHDYESLIISEGENVSFCLTGSSSGCTSAALETALTW